jgi:hypothetical protein
MTIEDIRSKAHRPIEIDLTGPEGNAFVLIGYAKKWAKQLGPEALMLLHGVTWDEIQKDMMSGDYEHLLGVIEKYFGKYVTMYR